jgi:hypothetical protein
MNTHITHQLRAGNIAKGDSELNEIVKRWI